MVSNRTHKIAVLGHCGNANLGDDALFAAVVQNVRARQPDAEIVGFTIDPEDSRQRHGIPAYPIRRPADSSGPAKAVQESGSGKLSRILKKVVPGLAPFARACRRIGAGLAAVPAEVKFLRQSYRRLCGTELLLVAGSQQLSDHFGGPWGFPYTVFKFTFLSKLTGTKVALLSVGVGPLRSPLSRFFARRVLNMVTYRSYRDTPSTQLARELGVKGSHPVLPDLVYSLELPPPKPTKAVSDRPVIGINPIPFYDGRYWHIVDDERYGKYVCELTKFADWTERSGHALLFFPTQMRSDPLTIADVRNGMQEPNSPNVLPSDRVEGVQDLINEISKSDMVVANRYHGMLFALAMGKPVLGLIYQEKGRALMEQVGQGEYVLEAKDLKAEDMIARFKSMEANASTIREQISSQLEPIRKSLQDQYDVALRLIGIEPVAIPVANATMVQPSQAPPHPVQPVVEVSH